MTDPWSGGQYAGSVRVRFAPSPGGHLHVDELRTALFGWAFARHTGGAFVLSIDDVDGPGDGTAEVAEEHVAAAREALHWLGLNWDEGPDQGGPYGPYRQSERIELYHQWAQRFLDTGYAYWCYCSPEELAARHESGAGTSDYDRYCRTLTPDQVQAYLAEGRQPVLRFRMPDGSTTFTDLLGGELTVDHQAVPDFVLMHADGRPLHGLTSAVDDATMRISHVIRDTSQLPATPRELAVYRAMGLPEDQFPVFAHVAGLVGEDGEKLSRHHAVTAIDRYRRDGFVPEALDNYLASLGWSPEDGRAEFTVDDLVGGFDLARVRTSAAEFDPAELETLNGTKIRALTPADFARRIVPFLAQSGLVTEPLSSDQMWFIRDGAPLIQDRITRLTEVPAQLAFLLVPDPGFHPQPADAAAVLTAEAATPLKAAAEALAALPDWTAEAIEQALSAALVDGPGPGPGPEAARTPVQVAVTGRREGPPLPGSLALLGRERTLARLASAQASLPS
ncbi:MAG: glutamate--tRNA ligase [Actinobacteria bacterium]|nr:glutamate--tRNA ligase [Actinomycetota bacterium]